MYYTILFLLIILCTYFSKTTFSICLLLLLHWFSHTWLIYVSFPHSNTWLIPTAQTPSTRKHYTGMSSKKENMLMHILYSLFHFISYSWSFLYDHPPVSKVRQQQAKLICGWMKLAVNQWSGYQYLKIGQIWLRKN